MRVFKIKLSNIKHWTISKLSDIHHIYASKFSEMQIKKTCTLKNKQLMNTLVIKKLVLGVSDSLNKLEMKFMLRLGFKSDFFLYL